MRVLLLDPGSNFLDTAMRAKACGHDVKWYDRPRADGSHRLAGTGMFDKIKDFQEIERKWIHWADIILMADNVHWLPMLEKYRMQGYPIVGGNLEAAKLELDRNAGQIALASCGIKIMDSVTFHDHNSAIAYVKKHPEFLVSKPNGDAAKSMSYVATSLADLVYMLERWKSDERLRKAAKDEGFILQTKIKGYEMAVGGYFGPGGFNAFKYENFEYKKLFNSDLGPNTGEQGTLSMMTKKSKLADMVLSPLEPVLSKIGYTGFVDTSVMVDESGTPWPMELTLARPGWPTNHNITAHVKNEDPIQWQLDLLNGFDTMECDEGEVCCSVVVAIPDYPYGRFTNRDVCGIPITGADDMENIHLSEVMLGDCHTMVGDKVVTMPGYVSSGDYILVATGVAKNVTAARKSVYGTLDKIKMAGSPFWRTDIGAGRMRKALPKLQALGFAKGMVY